MIKIDKNNFKKLLLYFKVDDTLNSSLKERGKPIMKTLLHTFNFASNIELYKLDDELVITRKKLKQGEIVTEMYDYENDMKNITPKCFLSQTTKDKIREELLNNKGVLQLMNNTETTNNPTLMTEDASLGMLKAIETMQQSMVAGFNALAQHNPYEQAIVQGIVSKAKGISTDDLLEDLKGSLNEFIEKEYGALPTILEIKQPEKDPKRITGLIHSQFQKILQVVSRDIPLMLVGPAGSGKNHTLEQVAEALDLDFYFTNAITQEYTLKGFIDANGRFHETEFYKAFVNGGLFFLDEIDASIPEALITLNAAIANRYFDFPNGRVDAHKDFRVVSAANTVGLGASTEYVGRNQLDGATLDRFVQIDFDYDANVESALSSSTELYDFVVSLRNAIKETGVRHIVSMRATINASKLEDIFDKKDIITDVILKGMEVEDMRLLQKQVVKNNPYSLAMKEVIG